MTLGLPRGDNRARCLAWHAVARLALVVDTEHLRRAFAEQHPGWEAWQSLKNGQWHARLVGHEPPLMLHDNSPGGLSEQITALGPRFAQPA